MPLPPKYPLRWRCGQCGWKADYLIRSDKIPSCGQCPKCRSRPVLKQEKGVFESLFGKWLK